MAGAPGVDNLGFLLAKASQRWNELLVEAFAAAGYGQVRASYGSVLLPLWEQDGLRMGELATRARLSKQTMTTLVRLAERDGLVTRRPDAADGRAIQVWLSPTAVDFAPVAGQVVSRLHRRVRVRLGQPASRAFAEALATVMNL
ncbi:MAG TPA: MarR family transcriptional regulator [Micromonosporaceae bacterium]|nr:MarR family transcriptional regulator [Micromonosporaceae bacterium]